LQVDVLSDLATDFEVGAITVRLNRPSDDMPERP